MFHRRAVIASLSGLCLAAPALAQAPAWPNGPIRIIAPFPPGGSVDTITRLLQPRLAAESTLGLATLTSRSRVMTTDCP